MPITTRLTLAAALADFTTRPLPDAATAFWKTLGYESNLYLPGLDTSPDGFARDFGIEAAFRPDRALTTHWRSVHFLFQLTSDELAAAGTRLRSDADKARSDSYLFFAIDLVPGTYARGTLAQMARELNRPFLSPILVLFRNGALLTLAVVDRRPSKTDAAKDVLEKVTLIKDIDVLHPHAAHVRILEELELSRLRVTTWDALHKAWRTVLDLSELNKSFFRELSNWYFWARTVATFPAAATENDRSVAVIRLITRAMFVYFIKERGLVPPVFFDPKELPGLLLDTSPSVGTYYNAILQNLFFAALNAEPAARGWQGEKKTFQGKNESYLDSTKRRGKELFKDPDNITKMFDRVPFLNGGLFECLDSEAKEGKPEVRHDGFSSNPKKRAVVPNYLFWGAAKSVDLNEIYQTKNKTYSVRPLLEILNRYKFTVTENLPLEEEVALDPELLGKVFENLLASYNPETATTARKQTGSFYTPREIVDYMVAESVVAYLETACADCDLTDGDLRALVSYDTDAPPLTPAQRVALIAAVGRITILDPACGSGAFPMGCLHRLTHLLKRLDDDGALWKAEQQRQIDALDIADVREAAQERFNEAVARDNGDYVRKLYLIERSLFGVDIQPIAVQISKLRFFISLVIEQKLDPADPARGVQPLPNLETKIVAANTLIRPGQGDIPLTSDKSAALEKKLSEVRRKHFSAREWSKKKKLREQDAELRAELAKELKADGMDPAAADLMAAWNPYDQNTFAPFFDIEWMFGPALKQGFDIVIGNPPYLRIQGIQADQSQSIKYYRQAFRAATGSFDLYALFIERGYQLLVQKGILALIVPHKFFQAAFGQGLRQYLNEAKALHTIVRFGALQVFEEATTYTCLLFLSKKKCNTFDYAEISSLSNANEVLSALFGRKNHTELSRVADHKSPEDGNNWDFSLSSDRKVLDRLNLHPYRLGGITRKIFVGLQTSSDKIYVLEESGRFEENGTEIVCCFSKEDNCNVEIEATLVKPFLMGRDIHRYDLPAAHNVVIFPYLINIESGKRTTKLMTQDWLKEYCPRGWNYLSRHSVALGNRENGKMRGNTFYAYVYPKNLNEFDASKIMTPDIALGCQMTIDANGGLYHTTTIYSFAFNGTYSASEKFILGILNSKVLWYYLTKTGNVQRGGYIRFKTEYLKPFPLPKPPDQTNHWPIERLADYQLSLASMKSKSNVSLMIVAFNRLLDGLVYELYFPEEFQSKQSLWNVIQDEDLPVLPNDVDTSWFSNLFRRLWAPDSLLRSLVWSLDESELIRTIESTSLDHATVL